MKSETDRELLELAARAAGIQIDWYTGGTVAVNVATGDNWNPLTDDGDGLRLAVELRMDVSYSSDGQRAYAGLGGEAPYCEAVRGGFDKFAITRRVIVRAAAEVGRQRNES